MTQSKSIPRPFIPAVLTFGVLMPLYVVLRSPQFDALRAVDLLLIFAAGACAGALVSLGVARMRWIRDESRRPHVG